jgi:peptide/nickel transport system ATP-binding protein
MSGLSASMPEARHAAETPLLEVRGLKKYFRVTKGIMRRQIGEVKAVDDVSFSVMKGTTLGIVGESGCGKTTAVRCILRAIEPTAGSILFDVDGERFDLASINRADLHRVRPHMQMVFQDPQSSLNPRMTVMNNIAEPLLVNNVAKGQALKDRVGELLTHVGLDAAHMSRYPHAFSGGQRQRIGIARALALNPSLVVADEPVSALDVSVQAQILNLLKQVQAEFGLTYVLISHDMGVVENLCDHVAVMYVGKLVEYGRTDDLFSTPRHPYTEALLASVPSINSAPVEEAAIVKGDVADPGNRPPGCCFHPRCRFAQPICSEEEPPLEDVSQNGAAPHLAACHFARELSLAGIVPDIPSERRENDMRGLGGEHLRRSE